MTIRIIRTCKGGGKRLIPGQETDELSETEENALIRNRKATRVEAKPEKKAAKNDG